jgi:hypothetical protein
MHYYNEHDTKPTAWLRERHSSASMSLPSFQSRERHNRRAIAIGSGGNVRAALADGPGRAPGHAPLRGHAQARGRHHRSRAG